MMATAYILHITISGLVCLAVYAQPLCENLNLLDCAELLGASDYVTHVKKLVISNRYEYGGNRTLFVPLNSAFESVPLSVKGRWTKDRIFLKDTLLYHLALNECGESDLANNLILNTNNRGYTLRVNRYQVEKNNITTVNGATLLDIPESDTTTGVLFLISRVLYTFPVTTAVDLVIGNSNFTTLLLAIAETGLTDMFEGDNITVLAPTDDAFDKLPPGVLVSLLKDVGKLRQILLNHMISDVWYVAGLQNNQVIKTAGGASLTVGINGTTIHFNSSKVIEADIPVGNGVVHVIDTVLVQ